MSQAHERVFELHDDEPESPTPFGAELARAVVEHRRATDAQYDALGARAQALHDQVSALSRKVDVVLVIQGEHSAALACIQSDLSAVVRAVTAQHRESVTNEAQLDAKIAETRAEVAKTKAIAVVRKGVFAVGVAAGTALALEWRAALNAIVSLLGG